MACPFVAFAVVAVEAYSCSYKVVALACPFAAFAVVAVVVDMLTARCSRFLDRGAFRDANCASSTPSSSERKSSRVSVAGPSRMCGR